MYQHFLFHYENFAIFSGSILNPPEDLITSFFGSGMLCSPRIQGRKKIPDLDPHQILVFLTLLIVILSSRKYHPECSS
jgi:hypothetical protein